ncbi:hypothetical protein M378DRAFT_18077 [Amanita muscaria Koide BX008]|uniref:Uncharacterized protein n=1 Tax=Amanita muscaria (strain Koide BX008) TaxID=946122 RepID=A0A0C2RY73_AMAMK|nr:hypothetical protein M378DRAFT_18077 [Amanita muscaria Koide BX008]
MSQTQSQTRTPSPDRRSLRRPSSLVNNCSFARRAVYSPKGSTVPLHSLNDLDMESARRGSRNIYRLRASWKEYYKGRGQQSKTIEAELEQEFLHYNVFLLSANEQKMRKDIPHFVMRVFITPEASTMLDGR